MEQLPVPQADWEQMPSEAEKADLTALRGGLKGRLAAEFAVLQSSMDALRRYTQDCGVPGVAAVAGQMLGEMDSRIARIERLADNAAELAVSTALRGAQERRPVEICGYLRELAACAAEELAGRGRQIAFAVENTVPPAADGTQAVWVLADRGLMNALLANLLSNSAAAQGCTRITLQCTAGRSLLYSDNGCGLPPEARALLLEGCFGSSTRSATRACM